MGVFFIGKDSDSVHASIFVLYRISLPLTSKGIGFIFFGEQMKYRFSRHHKKEELLVEFEEMWKSCWEKGT